jgi:hypothetical protein
MDPKKITDGNRKINAILSDIDETKVTEGLNANLNQPELENINIDDGFKLNSTDNEIPIIPEPQGNDYDKFNLILDEIDTNTKGMNLNNIKTNNIDNFKLPLLETMELVGKENLPLTESLQVLKVMDIQFDQPASKPGQTAPPKIELIIAEEQTIYDWSMETVEKYRLYIILGLLVLCFLFLFSR